VFKVETKIGRYINKKFFSFGANCPLVFGIAIPAFGYISPLRCEDTASIGAKGRIVLMIFIFWYFIRIVVIKTSFVKVLNFDKAVAFIFIFWKTKPLLNI
jgi:hypothetical protein